MLPSLGSGIVSFGHGWTTDHIASDKNSDSESNHGMVYGCRSLQSQLSAALPTVAWGKHIYILLIISHTITTFFTTIISSY